MVTDILSDHTILFARQYGADYLKDGSEDYYIFELFWLFGAATALGLMKTFGQRKLGRYITEGYYGKLVKAVLKEGYLGGDEAEAADYLDKQVGNYLQVASNSRGTSGLMYPLAKGYLSFLSMPLDPEKLLYIQMACNDVYSDTIAMLDRLKVK